MDLHKSRIPATLKAITNESSWEEEAEPLLDQQKEDNNAVTPPRQDPQALLLEPCDFQNWSNSDLDQVTLKSPRKWLKSDNVFFRRGVSKRSRSPTPTPNTKPRDQAFAISSTPVRPSAKIQPNHQAAWDVRKDFLSKPVYDVGFTPLNKRASPQNTETYVVHGHPDPAKPPESRTDNEEFSYPSKVTVREVILDKADGPIWQGHYGVKQLSLSAVQQALRNEGHIQARSLPEHTALRAREGSTKADVSHGTSHGSSNSIDKYALAIAAQTNDSRAFEDSLQALPPSTNLPEFAYRYARKQDPLPPQQRPSFAETLEIAKAKAEFLEMTNEKTKAKAQEQEIRRLSFTASGNVKDSKPISRKRLQHRTSSPLQQRRKSSLEQRQAIQANSSTAGNHPLAAVTSPPLTMSGALSYENDDQPEAQIVPPLPVVSSLVPSGPSTDMLETDNQPLNPQSIEEGDSYAHLSTQAAILKAQRSFQDALWSPVKTSSPRQHNEASTPVDSLSTHKATEATRKTHEPLRRPPPSSPKPLAPGSRDDGLMSTQAMVDAMSPFAITTIKKRDTNIALSPTSPTANLFPTHSLPASIISAHAQSPSFPISHTHSKPSSSGLTSFSIAPHSTLSDTYQQDGQQQPQLRYFDPSGWDLDTAIEEAGQFLGTWDVENEARKEAVRGSTGGSGKDNGEDRRGVGVEERMRKTRVGVVEG